MVSKKVVTILIIVALVLAIGSVIYNSISEGNKVSTNVPAIDNSGAGEVGVEVVAPILEDKNEQG